MPRIDQASPDGERCGLVASHTDRRDRAARQDPNFDYAQALYQIAIVLGSVSIVATSRRLLLVAVVLGGIATLLMLNGFLLLVELPGG